MNHDAIVIGAGLSGLICARRLIEAGARVLVVEARPRVGGRLVSGTVAGAVVDLGGQWMSVEQPRLLALAGELGVAALPQPRVGGPVIDEDVAGAGLFAQLAAAWAQWRAVRRITRMARAATGDAPANAVELDAVALGPWLAGAIGNPTARARIAMHAELVFAADPAGLSLLAYLARLGATGGFAPRGPDLPGGGRDHRFVGGAHALAGRLAERLGGAVVRDQPALAVEVDRDGAQIVRCASQRFRADRVVLAVPPRLGARLAPGLPGPIRQLAAANRAGPVVKCFAAYPRAFWRDAGLSGEAYRMVGTVRAVVDASPSDAGVAVLQAFIVGSAAAGWHVRDPDDRRAELLDSLAALFGEPARTPLDTLEADWAIDPWSAGCVAGTGPGALTAHGARASWRGCHDRVHLAGTEAAVRWPGYMEGALEAGERAADEVLGAASTRASTT